MDKINISNIFKDHFQTLRHYDKKQASFLDFLLFYGFPLLMGALLSWHLRVDFFIGVSTELITFYAVLGGFMLNLLALIYGFNTEKFNNPFLAKEVLRESVSNISYLIAVASLLVILLFILKVGTGINSDFGIGNQTIISISEHIIVSFFVFSFINFCLTIFMVLKRFYSLNSNRE
ncbi:MAG: hypothetical protein RLY66_184 [Candidatus Parcubacteria bacterium]|jgi:hypothetical protein